MNQSIYKIQNECQLIIAEVINNEGEITPELETALTYSSCSFSSCMYRFAISIKASSVIISLYLFSIVVQF